MPCDICNGEGRVRLPVRTELNAIDLMNDYVPTVAPEAVRAFDCPQCAPRVPYRLVKAKKVSTAYPAEEFGRLQVPIERTLAARFGEYLYREGLIKFTTDSLDDFTKSKITVTAHLGVVSHEDVKKAGAVEEVALTNPPPLSKKLTRQQQERARVSPRAVRWEPSAPAWATDEPATDEFEDPKDAISSRFSGLEL